MIIWQGQTVRYWGHMLAIENENCLNNILLCTTIRLSITEIGLQIGKKQKEQGKGVETGTRQRYQSVTGRYKRTFGNNVWIFWLSYTVCGDITSGKQQYQYCYTVSLLACQAVYWTKQRIAINITCCLHKQLRHFCWFVTVTQGQNTSRVPTSGPSKGRYVS